MATFAQAATPICKANIQASLEILRSKDRRAAPVTGAARKTERSWHANPEGFRRLIVRNAGLPSDVVDKLDRDLTEPEKALIRATAARMKSFLDGVAAL